MAAEYTIKKNKKECGIAFTKRESQCIYHALEGKNLQQIAENLHITKRSVCFYLTNAKQKIDVLT